MKVNVDANRSENPHEGTETPSGNGSEGGERVELLPESPRPWHIWNRGDGAIFWFNHDTREWVQEDSLVQAIRSCNERYPGGNTVRSGDIPGI